MANAANRHIRQSGLYSALRGAVQRPGGAIAVLRTRRNATIYNFYLFGKTEGRPGERERRLTNTAVGKLRLNLGSEATRFARYLLY